MTSFTDLHRKVHGIEPTCTELPIAPSTYYEQKARQADLGRLLKRAKRDAFLRPEISLIWEANFQIHGTCKAWRQLSREEIKVARCTVERVTRAMGLQGMVRGQKCKTTIPDKNAERPADLVKRDFTASRPSQL